MNLKEFVSLTLNQIAEGVKEAQAKYEELGGVVNPKDFSSSDKAAQIIQSVGEYSLNRFLLTDVEFDVELSKDETSDGGGDVTVSFGFISGKGGKSKGTKNLSSTRIKFNIPVLLPSQPIPS